MGNKSASRAASPNSPSAAPPPRGDEEDDDDYGEDGGVFRDTDGERSRKPSYYQMAKSAYDSLVRAIIRPPRCGYELRHLGPLQFDFCGKVYKRTDFELRNQRGMKIVCSHWEAMAQHRQHTILPCVVYMHGNSSARLEAIPQLAPVLSLGATLLAFDFCGSGKSDGEWVSLGAFEKDDLQVVIEHLRSTGTTSTIALWGRSMGAATSLLHGERDPSIAGMVLDSSFSDLQKLAEEMVERGRGQGLFAPGFVVAMAIRWIRSSVKKQADFDIHDLAPIRHADKCFIPALFVAAEGDEFVPKHHSEDIHRVYAGDKSIIVVEGDHNSIRPQFAYDSISNFLQTVLYIPSEWLLEEGFRYAGMPPWSLGAAAYRQRDLSDDVAVASSIRESQAAARPARKHFGQGAAPAAQAGNAMARIERSERGRALSRDATGNFSSSNAGPGPPLPTPSSETAPARRTLDDALARQQMAVGMSRDQQRGVESTLFNFLSGGQGQSSSPANAETAAAEVEVWECRVCTLINGAADKFCVACDSPSP